MKRGPSDMAPEIPEFSDQVGRFPGEEAATEADDDPDVGEHNYEEFEDADVNSDDADGNL